MFNEIISSYPRESLIVIAILVTMAMTLVTKYFTNQERMKELKEIQKACRIELKGKEPNSEEWKKINQKMLECSMEMMKHSMKPLFITFLPLILLLAWVRGAYTEVLPHWLWWYFAAGLISSIAFRKIFNVH